jgi:hypothetical protein
MALPSCMENVDTLIHTFPLTSGVVMLFIFQRASAELLRFRFFIVVSMLVVVSYYSVAVP